jgi:hypothetical protein
MACLLLLAVSQFVLFHGHTKWLQHARALNPMLFGVFGASWLCRTACRLPIMCSSVVCMVHVW